MGYKEMVALDIKKYSLWSKSVSVRLYEDKDNRTPESSVNCTPVSGLYSTGGLSFSSKISTSVVTIELTSSESSK